MLTRGVDPADAAVAAVTTPTASREAAPAVAIARNRVTRFTMEGLSIVDEVGLRAWGHSPVKPLARAIDMSKHVNSFCSRRCSESCAQSGTGIPRGVPRHDPPEI